MGISFFTIQQLTYVIDSYTHDTKNYSFLEYAIYVSFFPQLIAGPILRHNEFIPQLKDDNQVKVNYSNLTYGFILFTLGLFKKTLIADIIAIPADWAYDNIQFLSGFDAFFSMICFSFQLYFDFSAYSDMATGISAMFNIRLPQNFNSPYKALSISDFWKRWHMTLTSFLTTYLYIPLGGNRKGQYRTYLNIFLVFLVSGIWHGANYTYMLWGILHGLALILYRIFGKYTDRLPKILRWLSTFVYVSLLFGLFRADGLHDYFAMIKKIFSSDWTPTADFLSSFDVLELSTLYSIFGLEDFKNHFYILSFLLLLLGCLLIVLLGRNNYEKLAKMINLAEDSPEIKNVNISIPKLIIYALIFVCCIFTLGSISKFLYFNF